VDTPSDGRFSDPIDVDLGTVLDEANDQLDVAEKVEDVDPFVASCS
jgi:hypothetical protein